MAGLFQLAAPALAHAHFVLKRPAAWIVEDALGNPQKDAPCGGENGGVRSGLVTTYRAGATIEVEWQETVGHPGHFRIALARDRADLEDPAVETTNGDGVTGLSLTAEIMDPPVYPVLLDNVDPRSLVFTPQEEPHIARVQLPNETCELCTLQVIQFMANHVPGYFYHHCADIRIVGADEDVPDTGIVVDTLSGAGGASMGGGAGDGGSVGASDESEGGGCSLEAVGARGSRASLPVLLLGLAVAARRVRGAARQG